MKIEYQLAKNYSERKNFYNYLEMLASRPDITRVCEIGGGANPSMSIDFIEKYRLKYTILDISAEQLEKAPPQYHKIQGDIGSPDLRVDNQYDLVFSRMLAEHISNAFIFHKNVSSLLRKEGFSFHFFPTLYSLPFVINALLPQKLSDQLLYFLNPYRKYHEKMGKFPAYYQWCRGPIKSQIKRFENLGFKVEEYIGFFGTPHYYKKLKPLQVLDEYISSFLVKYPVPQITSYAYILLRKEFAV